MYSHGNLGIIRQESLKITDAICWIKCFSEAYGQYSPQEKVTILSHWLSKQTLYKMYCSEVAQDPISQSAFYDLFKSKFGPNRDDPSLPWIRISAYSSHSVCNTCKVIERQIITPPTPEKKIEFVPNFVHASMLHLEIHF